MFALARLIAFVYKIRMNVTKKRVSRCGLAVRRLAGKQKDLGSFRFGSLQAALLSVQVLYMLVSSGQSSKAELLKRTTAF